MPEQELCVKCIEDLGDFQTSGSTCRPDIKPREAVFRCTECGPQKYFCVACAKQLHRSRNYYHVLEKWQVIIH